MPTIDFTDEEARMLRNALIAFLHDFGHDEDEVVNPLKRLLTKLEAS